MSKTKKVWLVKFNNLNDPVNSVYVITDNICTATERSIEIYNKIFGDVFTEDNIISIEFVCSVEK